MKTPSVSLPRVPLVLPVAGVSVLLPSDRLVSQSKLPQFSKGESVSLRLARPYSASAPLPAGSPSAAAEDRNKPAASMETIHHLEEYEDNTADVINEYYL
ncbi:Fc receptor-like protein 2 isoform X2 [Lates japonicus]|uniref:Fc receptor-like protein 2 isoform X2 n=1 Tax=Lates japonicus TaxID=270547 RepID=A0AAD3M4X1_LATJO|nr:Fc receptor-like protein 2 isoform X2 [Lates japonicus]